jgi:opacity protein-like surface antigen
MRVYKSAVFAIVAFTFGAMPARAQNAPTVAVTPFVAMGTDGASPIGAAIAFPISSALSVETDVAYRRGEGNIHAPSTNASLLFSLPRAGRFTPYAAVGVGLARYGAAVRFRPVATGELQLGTASRLATTVNFGGGIKAQITDRMDFRTDVRWFQSPASQANADQFRVALGVGFNVGKR